MWKLSTSKAICGNYPHNYIVNNFSKNLKTLRTEKGLSQEGLAKVIGYQRTNVADWESGRAIPHVDTLIKIAGFFNVSLDVLLKEEY